MYIYTHMYIVWTPPFLKGGKVNFKYLPRWGRELEKWKYGAGARLLKRGTGTFPI